MALPADLSLDRDEREFEIPPELVVESDAQQDPDEAAYFREVSDGLGLDQVRFVTKPRGNLALDRRGDAFFDPEKLAALPPVVREVVRGRFGPLLHAATGGDGTTNVIEATALAPIAVGLLEPGDGTAEALLAVTAATILVMNGRVVGRLSDSLSKPSLSQTNLAYGGLHAKLSKGLAVTLESLAKIRALRAESDRDVRIVQRHVEEKDHAGAAH